MCMWMRRRSSLEAHGASSLVVLRVIGASLWGQWFVALELKEPSLLTCLGAKRCELGVFSHTGLRSHSTAQCREDHVVQWQREGQAWL